MREILFRGFHPCDGLDTIVVDGEKVKGRWVKGGYTYHIKRTLSPIGDSLKPEDEAYYILTDAFSDWNLPRGIDAIEVLPSTVGQYTGLTDKNGKRIFEGDILRLSSYIKQMFPNAEDGPVKFSRGCFRVSGSFTGLFDVLADCEGEYIRGEVIGTVFDEETPQ